MNTYQVTANGHVLGTYTAADQQGARDLCANDAGYADEAHMMRMLGQPSELEAVAIGTPDFQPCQFGAL